MMDTKEKKSKKKNPNSLYKEDDKDQELKRLKKSVESWRSYFDQNITRFNYFKNFVFNSTLSADEVALLGILKKPALQFNVSEAYISRLRGEFSKQEPSIHVSAAENPDEISMETIEFVQSHLKYLLCEANKASLEYDVYTDQLAGGFSAAKVITDYVTPKSFDQCIKIMPVFDPTLCGFDPLARASHKGDGRFCFELYPKTKEEFEAEYPDIDISKINFTRSSGKFNWSYSTDREDILLMTDYYEKRCKPVEIVKLVNGKTLTKEEYEDYLEQWEAAGHFELPAKIVEERTTNITEIYRYIFIEDQILKVEKTDFSYLPIVFADGNSQQLRDTEGNASYQMSRPYVMHVEGAQKLLNFSGQTLANHMENMIAQKWITPIEAIPDGCEDIYANPQQQAVLPYNQYKDNNPDMRLDPPREANIMPLPPEVANAFMSMDSLIQKILGAYDGAAGNAGARLISGVAVREALSQSNATAMPYVENFLQFLEQIGCICVDLFPKYYVTPRTLPVINKKGERSYIKINQQGGINQKTPEKPLYEDNALQVKVEAGLNFEVQKVQTLEIITKMMGQSKLFDEMINTMGLGFLVDNLPGARGIDQLKLMVKQFMEKKAQQEQQAQQMQQQQMQNNPIVMRNQIEMQKLQAEAQQNQISNQIDVAQLEIDKSKTENDRLSMLAKLEQSEREGVLKEEAMDTERMGKAVDLTIAMVRDDHDRKMSLRQHDREDRRFEFEQSQSKEEKRRPRGRPKK